MRQKYAAGLHLPHCKFRGAGDELGGDPLRAPGRHPGVVEEDADVADEVHQFVGGQVDEDSYIQSLLLQFWNDPSSCQG